MSIGLFSNPLRRRRGVGRPAGRPLACVVLLATLAPSCWAAGAADTDRELEAVRDRMASLQKEIRRDTDRRDRVVAQLRDAELAQATIVTRLGELAASRAASEAEFERLGGQRSRALVALAGQTEKLIEQIRTAYVNGPQEQLKVLLNQSDPAVIGRMMVYYGYLTDRRAARVNDVREQLAYIESLRAAQRAETDRIGELERQQAEQLEAMKAARREREALIAKLDERLEDQGSRFAALQAREADLLSLIEELQRIFTDQPSPQEQFAGLKGTLEWPVAGITLARFGEARAGSRVRWNGILIGADRGYEVRAIAHGRVAFADWLPGMGLLIIVEHGDDFLSLYAHAETLNKAVGDWVEPGAVLATVGDSGGQPEPALYFEIRRDGKPQNPQPWFAGRLPRP